MATTYSVDSPAKVFVDGVLYEIGAGRYWVSAVVTEPAQATPYWSIVFTTQDSKTQTVKSSHVSCFPIVA